MTVPKGELEVKKSKALSRTFKQMKDYIVENQGLIGKREFLQRSMQITINAIFKPKYKSCGKTGGRSGRYIK